MIQDIRYSGFTTNPSDYDSPDGDLALSLNLLHEEGSLKPIFQPTQRTGQLPSGVRILCIHTTTNFTHYIIHNETADETDANRYKIGYIDVNSLSLNPTYTDIYITKSVITTKCIGNAVIVLTSDCIHKLLWTLSGDESKYKDIPINFPETKMSFGLNAYFKYSFQDEFTIPGVIEDGNPKPTGEGVSTLMNKAASKANKMIAEISKSGRFCMPFFVRYAYRLYDGSLTYQSAPVLMIPNSNGSPLIFIDKATASSNVLSLSYVMFSPSCRLDAQALMTQEQIEELNSISDIIKSVDIFVSAPIYSYDQDGEKCSFRARGENENTFGVFSIKSTDAEEWYSQHSRSEEYNKFSNYATHSIADSFTACTGLYSGGFIELPKKTDNSINESIKNNSNFYLIKSIPIEELSDWTERKDIELDEDVLPSLVTRETLIDDYYSHYSLSADNVFGYNSRLLLSNVKYGIIANQSSFPFTDKDITNYTFDAGSNIGHINLYEDRYLGSGSVTIREPFSINKIVHRIERDGSLYIIHEDVEIKLSGICKPGSNRVYVPYMYSIDGMTKNISLYGTLPFGQSTINVVLSLPVKPHDMLNGSYYYNNFDNQSTTTYTQIPAETSKKSFSLPNRIYVSEVNNPFVFPASSIVSVGSGSVIGVSTAAQALSQGQFGSFPLYAFTTDGVWALSVSSTGAFSAVQPITRDVCINAKSITQLDGSVLFASDRGIINLSGSQVNCISDAIFTDAFDVSSLPKMDVLHALLHTGSSSCDCIKTKPFLPFIQGCQMIYDYINQHVIIFNPSTSNGAPVYRYAYVLSLKSLSWGMIESDIEYSVDSYPHAMAVDRSRHILTYDGSKANSCKALFVTRPIKMGNGDVLKSIHSLLQRGNFNGLKVVNGTVDPGDVDTVLYGSRDMANWHIVASSKSNRIDNLRGTPYKYYRIAGFASLTKDKSISCATIDVIPRETTKVH